jgi:hypothetical protein
LLNKLHITFDEPPRPQRNGKVSCEDFKVLDNDVITTREMHSNDETISLCCDCDFNTNTKNFSGLFKDNAIKRRTYPIKKVLVKQFQSEEEQDKRWDFPHQCIASKHFARSYVKFIRETPMEVVRQHMNDSADVIIPNLHSYNLDQNNHFLFEILQANQDSFDEWFEAIAQNTSKLLKHILLQPYEGFTFDFTFHDLYHSYNPNPHNHSYKLDKNNFTERLRDKIDVVMCENPLRVNVKLVMQLKVLGSWVKSLNYLIS